MSARLAILAALAAGALIWACDPTDGEAECRTACATADRCGLLPSPLGARVEGVDLTENCVERCQISDIPVRTSVVQCLSPASDVPGKAKAWCGDPGDPAGSLVCDRAATCLAGHFGDAVLGKGSLEVTVRRGGVVEASQDAPQSLTCSTCDDSTCTLHGCDPRICTPAFQEESATEWCRIVQAVDVQPFLLRGTRHVFGVADSCSRQLIHPVRFDDLAPGAVRAGIKVRGSRPVLDAGAATAPTYCWVFYGPRVVVSAGEVDHGVVQVLDPNALVALRADWRHTCEDSLEACTDHVDNDDDGFADCSDDQCATFCATGAAACDAGPAIDGACPAGEAAAVDAAAGGLDGSLDAGIGDATRDGD